MIYTYTLLLLLLLLLFAQEILLLFFAWFLRPILSILNFISVLIVYVKEYQFWTVIKKYYLQNAMQIDISSHYDHRAFWNLTSHKRKSNGTKFGHNIEKRDETLSSMFGRKKEEKSLILLGWAMYYILYGIDYSNWFKGGHCKVAFESYKLKN